MASNLRDAPEDFTGSAYLATVTAGPRVVAAAMQTPPYNLVLSEIDDPGAIDHLADDLVDRDLPGALGPVDHVRVFVDARLARGGPPAPLDVSERIFRLTEVRPPNAPVQLIILGVQVLAGVILPSAIIFLQLQLNDRDLLGPYTNRWWNNVINWTIIAVLFALSVILAIQVLAPNLFPTT